MNFENRMVVYIIVCVGLHILGWILCRVGKCVDSEQLTFMGVCTVSIACLATMLTVICYIFDVSGVLL